MMMLQYANLALRFLLELCALAALGYAGFHTGQNMIVKLALAIGAPLIAAAVWGAFIAPRATVVVPTWLWLVLQAIIFGAAGVGLAMTDHRALAVTFLLVVALNGVLLYVSRT
jgi:hypothetical protein